MKNFLIALSLGVSLFTTAFAGTKEVTLRRAMMSEIREVSAACKGNFNGSCMQAACTRPGSYGCDSMSEIEEVTLACSGRL